MTDKFSNLDSDAGVAAVVEAAKNAVRATFDNGSLPPVAMFIATRHPKTGEPLPAACPVCVAMDTSNKDALALQLREFAAQCGAVAAVVCMEGRQKTIMGQDMGRVVVITVERDGTANGQFAIAYIQESGDTATLSDWHEGDGELGMSRFGLLLPSNNKEIQ